MRITANSETSPGTVALCAAMATEAQVAGNPGLEAAPVDGVAMPHDLQQEPLARSEVVQRPGFQHRKSAIAAASWRRTRAPRARAAPRQHVERNCSVLACVPRALPVLAILETLPASGFICL